MRKLGIVKSRGCGQENSSGGLLVTPELEATVVYKRVGMVHVDNSQ